MGGSLLHIEDVVEWDMLLEKTQVVVVDCEHRGPDDSR